MKEGNVNVSEHLKILYSEGNYHQIIRIVDQTQNSRNHYKFMKARALIFLGRYELVLDLLDNINTDNFVDKAIILYLKAWTFQRLGEIDKMIKYAEKSYSLRDHIDLSRDYELETFA